MAGVGRGARRELDFSFAVERTANEITQPLRGMVIFTFEQLITQNTVNIPEGLQFFAFWPLSRKQKEKYPLRSLRLEQSGRLTFTHLPS
jgi:hypothetical protein